MVYLSSSLALAALEYLVHVEVPMVPSDLISVEVDLPNDVSREQIDSDTLPRDWNALSDHPACVDLGDDWVRRGETCLLFVPSAVIPRSWNVLLNPANPEARRLARSTEPFSFDRRLLE